MQSGCGLVQNIKRAPGLPLGKLTREFNSLRFSARQGRGRLAELHVAESDFHDGGKLLLNLRNVFKELERVHGLHVQDVADRVALEAHCESFGIVTPPAAYFAHHVNIGQEIHLDAAQAITLASFAAAALDVEAEAAGLVATF